MKMPEMEQTSEFTGRKKEFLKLTAGNHTVRLLPGNEGFYITYTHWIHNANLECLGDECPICLNNKRIVAETGEGYKDVKGYSRKRQVFYVNALDRTLAKTCPSCGQVHKPILGTFASVCTSCNAVLVNEEANPLNKVVILNRGTELYDQIKTINSSVLDEISGERVGVENFDLMIMVPAKTKRPSASAMPHKNDPVEITDELYTLSEAPLHLEAGEVKSFLSGASLKDIFATRRANSAVEENVADNPIFEPKVEKPSEVKRPPWEEKEVEVVNTVTESVVNTTQGADAPSVESAVSSEDIELEDAVKSLFDL